MADKKGRVQEIIQRNLSEIIIYGLQDPLTSFASVNEVKVTPDYSYATIYVSHIIPEKTEELIRFLNQNKGKIRSMLAAKISIYKTPELVFVKDELYEKGQAMDALIDKANTQTPLTLKDLPSSQPAKKKAVKKAKTSKKKAVKKVVRKPVKKAIAKAAKKPIAKAKKK